MEESEEDEACKRSWIEGCRQGNDQGARSVSFGGEKDGRKGRVRSSVAESLARFVIFRCV